MKKLLENILVILVGTLVILSGAMILPAEGKIQGSSTRVFIAEYGGYGIKGEWETLGVATANMTFENESGAGWITLGENRYLVSASKQEVIQRDGEDSIIYEGNLVGDNGIVRFALYRDVMAGEIDVKGIVFSFGVAQTLDSARYILDQYNEHLQEEIEPGLFEDVIVPDDEIAIPATVDIDPDTLSLRSKGKWITAYIELQEHPELPGFNVTQIDVSTVKLNDQIPAESRLKYDFVADPNSYLMDHDDDGLLERMVKFNGAAVQDMLEPSDRVKIEVTGSLMDGTPFYGIDWIKVLGEKDSKAFAYTVDSTVEVQDTDHTECTECSAGEKGALSEQASQPEIDSSSSLYQRFMFTLPGGYVAAGIGMRNRGYGDITISGIPPGSTIEAAYLYWDILDDVESSQFKNGKFNGIPITGTKIGEGPDPCWQPSKHFAYRADVTGLVTGDAVYSLADFASGRRDGCDPWSDPYPFPQMEGASLVVIYRNPALSLQTIVIYDGAETLISTEYTHTISGFLVPSSLISASITYIGADGQNAPEATYFNGVRIGDSDWDGSDPQAGPSYSNGNLWDTNTYDVTSLLSPGDSSATANVRSYGDCLVWIATVFSISTVSDDREVSVLAVADEEYVDYWDDWWDPWDQDQWRSEVRQAVELGDDAFEREFGINFVVKDTGTWDSDDGVDELTRLFDEVRREVDKGTNDVMVAFTNQDVEGCLRTRFFLGGPYFWGTLGYAEASGDDVIVLLVEDTNTDNVHQHEYSHLFGAPDHDGAPGIRCIMSYDWVMQINDWCNECYSTINANKWREF